MMFLVKGFAKSNSNQTLRVCGLSFTFYVSRLNNQSPSKGWKKNTGFQPIYISAIYRGSHVILWSFRRGETIKMTPLQVPVGPVGVAT